MAYPNNTARCVFHFLMPNGSNAYVTPHVRSFDGSDLDSGDVQTIAQMLADWWTNADFEGETNVSLRNVTNVNITLVDITVTSLDPTAPPQYTEAVNLQGLSNTDPLPNETALVVTLYTGIVGRSYRGRNFWPSLGVGAMDTNGTIDNGIRTQLQDTFDALIAGFVNQGDYVLAVNSDTLSGVNQVISCVVRDTLHHQRRRNS